MDTAQYTTLLAAMQAIPDPLKRRGQRFAWPLLLTLIAAGLATGFATARALAQWVRGHADDLQAMLPALTRLPSEATVLRTMRQLDVARLEPAIAQFIATLPAPPTPTPPPAPPPAYAGQALDGKIIRTVSASGRRMHLLSLVQHVTGRTLAQQALQGREVEVAGSQPMLAHRDLTGVLVTLDAGFTHRDVAQTIRTQHGHYLMMVKDNHPTMVAEIATFFALPGIVADDDQYDRVQTVSKGHGRLEIRTLERIQGACGDWQWPDVQQVVRRTCERIILKTGERSVHVHYGLTSVPVDESDAAQLERWWRGHWTIENRSHHVRDRTMGEDRHPVRTGHAPQGLAAIRNGLIALWRAQGWRNIADALRACALSVHETLSLIGALPATTLT